MRTHPDVPTVILNTTVAAAFGGLAGMALTWQRDDRPDVVTIMGRSPGLVGITTSASLNEPVQAAIVGMAAATAVMQGGIPWRSHGSGSTTRSTRFQSTSVRASGGHSPSASWATRTLPPAPAGSNRSACS